jgi:hypothetical protein
MLVLTRSLLNPLLRLGATEEESTVELEHGGVNYYKRHNIISEVNGVNVYISHVGNLD